MFPEANRKEVEVAIESLVKSRDGSKMSSLVNGRSDYVNKVEFEANEDPQSETYDDTIENQEGAGVHFDVNGPHQEKEITDSSNKNLVDSNEDSLPKSRLQEEFSWVKKPEESCCEHCKNEVVDQEPETLKEQSNGNRMTEYREDNMKTLKENNGETIEKTNILSKKVKLVRSPIHKYFLFDELTGKSTCKTCDAEMGGKNPSSLAKHVKYKHREVFSKYQAEYREAKEEIVKHQTMVENSMKSCNL